MRCVCDVCGRLRPKLDIKLKMQKFCQNASKHIQHKRLPTYSQTVYPLAFGVYPNVFILSKRFSNFSNFNFDLCINQKKLLKKKKKRAKGG